MTYTGLFMLTIYFILKSGNAFSLSTNTCDFFGVSLTSLLTDGTKQKCLTSTDSKFTYHFTVPACGIAPTIPCGSKGNGVIDQTYTSDKRSASNCGNYTSSWALTLFNNNQVAIFNMYTGGDPADQSNRLRRTYLYFTCATGASTSLTYEIANDVHLAGIYTTVIATNDTKVCNDLSMTVPRYSTPPNTCSVYGIDLSSFLLGAGNIQHCFSFTDKSYTYFFTIPVCGIPPNPKCGADNTLVNGYAYQKGTSTPVDLGHYNNSWFLTTYKNQAALMTMYSGGDYKSCSTGTGYDRVTMIYILCGAPAYSEYENSNEDPCTYIITVWTLDSNVCSGLASALSYQPTTVPSPAPSWYPTSAPTCGAGYKITSDGCTICPIGSSSHKLSLNCTICSAGYYAPTAGSATCSECRPGYVQPNTGASFCSACIAGYSQPSAGSTDCIICQPGYYSSSPGTASCIACTPGYYQSSYGATSIGKKCDYPYSTPFAASTQPSDCTAFCLCLEERMVIALMLFIVIVWLTIVMFQTKRWLILAILIFPVSSVFTDILYSLTQRFYQPTLFYLASVFFLFPIPCFLDTLYQVKALIPDLFLLKLNTIILHWIVDKDSDTKFVYPQFKLFPDSKYVFFGISVKSVEECVGLLLCPLCWIIAIAIQVVYIIARPILLIMAAIFFIFWLFVGMYLHMFKLIAFKEVWNFWFWVWKNDNYSLYVTKVDIDTAHLNSCLSHVFFYETVPHLIVQIINNTYLGIWDPISIITIITSGASAFSFIHKFIYHRYIKKKSTEMKDIDVGGILVSLLEALSVFTKDEGKEVLIEAACKRKSEKMFRRTSLLDHFYSSLCPRCLNPKKAAMPLANECDKDEKDEKKAKFDEEKSLS